MYAHQCSLQKYLQNQDTEATEVPTDGWKDKEKVVHSHNGILFSHT